MDAWRKFRPHFVDNVPAGEANARSYFQGYIGAALDGVGGSLRRAPRSLRSAVAITRKWLEWSDPVMVFVGDPIVTPHDLGTIVRGEREACRLACEVVGSMGDGDPVWSGAVESCCDAINRRNDEV